MAHLIRKEGEAYQVMTVGDAAWHRLGTNPKEMQTAEQVLQQVNMNFTVDTQPLFLPDGSIVPDHRSTYRTDTSEYLGVVGMKYCPVQNIEAFSFFDQIVGEGEAIYTSAGVIGKGEKVWLQARLPAFMKVADDAVDQYLLFTNVHDGSGSVDVRFTKVRVVCNNTISAAMNRKVPHIVRIRHTKSASAAIAKAHRILEISNKYFEDIAVLFNRMAETKSNPEIDQLCFARAIKGNPNLAPGFKLETRMLNVLDTIKAADRSDLSMEKYDGTVWRSFNAATYFVDHMRDYRKGTQFEGSVYGSGAIFRQNVLSSMVKEYALV